MLENFVLVVMGTENKEACGTYQLCGGLDVGIEGGTYAVRILCQQHYQEGDWGFLLIDTHNGFNKDNHTAMLWAVQYEWASGGRLAFN